MDHDHLFSFALRERYRLFGCICTAGWVTSLQVDSDTLQWAKLQEQIQFGQSMLSEITCMWTGIPLAELYTTLDERTDIVIDCNKKYQVVDAILKKARSFLWYHKLKSSSYHWLKHNYHKMWSKINAKLTKMKRGKIPGMVHKQEGTMSPVRSWQIYCKSDLGHTSAWPGDVNSVAPCSYN